jgi:hypothetical protein
MYYLKYIANRDDGLKSPIIDDQINGNFNTQSTVRILSDIKVIPNIISIEYGKLLFLGRSDDVVPLTNLNLPTSHP